MTKPREINAICKIQIDPRDVAKVRGWDADKLRAIVPELVELRFSAKTSAGIRLAISVAQPSPLDLFNSLG